MAEAHEWTLRRLREMAGRLTEQAYLRASAAAGHDDEAHARWMLVFDRMARGLRLSIALEARFSRERRWDAGEIASRRCEPRGRRSSGGEDAGPCESDHEREDDDGLPAGASVAERIGRLQAIIEGAGTPPEPAPPWPRPERQALAAQRDERARRAASPYPPDEPWDVLTAAERLDHGDPAWRGSG